MKKFLKQFAFVCFLTLILVLPFFALAQISDSSVTGRLQQAGTVAGFSSDTDELTLAKTIGSVVNTVLSLLGVVFMILIIIGGYRWMTAGGNEESVKSAQGRIKNAVIGLIIVISSYALWMIIEKYLLDKI
ncbi:hypothetical protein CVU82_03910 [Candidatus Falkowbacteria bacterium HGW-Falkowbacteria-1]|jgi:hypothetical protein|uniref:DUF4134 domain-containing protein n=1 Tax=Candidatus Falkowbacteria bacterium HGW-Falkowbacteria-1 TaxID=2013768 RepID=A0A2N2E8W9_9BACT|nr:MAG: hypothetical protein CVU82_03910 [Candidatus Falkowbacteria bacterium HGW-Falkowbacteria-1]